MGCPFQAKRDRKGHGEGDVKNVQFLGDILNGCSLTRNSSATLFFFTFPSHSLSDEMRAMCGLLPYLIEC